MPELHPNDGSDIHKLAKMNDLTNHVKQTQNVTTEMLERKGAFGMNQLTIFHSTKLNAISKRRYPALMRFLCVGNDYLSFFIWYNHGTIKSPQEILDPV